MYSPPPGHYRLRADLQLPDGEHIRSNEVELEVTSETVLSARTQRNNPVLDGLLLLVTRDDANAPFVMRQYNYSEPLGSWYCEGLPIAEPVIVAHPTYFATDSFDHFFERWIVFRDGEKVVAAHFMNGKPTGARLEAPFAASWRLLPSACDHGAGRVELFVVEGEQLLALAFAPGTLTERFRVPLPAGIEGDPEVVGDRSGYWLAVPNAGLLTSRVDNAGRVEALAAPVQLGSLVREAVDRSGGRPSDGGVLGRAYGAPLAAGRSRARSGARQLAVHRAKGSARSARGVGFRLRRTRRLPPARPRQRRPLLSAARRRAALARPPSASPRPASFCSAGRAPRLFDAERGYNFYYFKNGVLYRDPEPELPENA